MVTQIGLYSKILCFIYKILYTNSINAWTEVSMKLLRYGDAGHEKPGLLDKQGFIRDLSLVIPDVTGTTLSIEMLAKLTRLNSESLPLIETHPRIGPCVGRVSNYIGIGLNYKDHAIEMGASLPIEPVVFNKVTSAINGPYDDVVIPRGSTKTDWEVELAVVIGTQAIYVSEQNALDYVAGFCIANDISERALQKEGTGQWVKGKSCPTFAPIGPWLVTVDEIEDVQNLDLWLEVDGQRQQTGNTKDMIFSVRYLISYLSRFFILQPGDIISTGTPAGVGLGHKPQPIYLKSGQVMHLSVSGLGEQRQKVIAG